MLDHNIAIVTMSISSFRTCYTLSLCACVPICTQGPARYSVTLLSEVSNSVVPVKITISVYDCVSSMHVCVNVVTTS